MKLLVVDNEAICRMALTGMLRSYGHVDMASDGRSAVELFDLALQEGDRYGLVCLDLMMPEMSGQEVLLALRKLEEKAGIPLGHGAKIVMITASAANDDVLAAFRSNCDAYLVKPVVRHKIEPLLAEMGIKPTR